MKHKYFKKAWQSLCQQPIVTTVSIIGTALSIFLIMVVVLMHEVKVLPFAPESERDRMMHAASLVLTDQINGDESQNTSSGGFCLSLLQELFDHSKYIETMTIYQAYSETTLLSNGVDATSMKADMKQTDDKFWRVFNFDFIDGKPYDEATFKSAQKMAVICESAAKQLFGTSKVAGREVQLNYQPFRIIGVVHDVSNLTESAYAQVWTPYTTSQIVQNAWSGFNGPKIGGQLSASMILYKSSDKSKLKAETKRRIAVINSRLKSFGTKIVNMGYPYNQFEKSIDEYTNVKPDPAGFYRQQFFILLILLLIPTINLTSMTHSRLRRYVGEIGVKRAFGYRRSQIIQDIIIENLVLSVAAGLIGLLLCILFAYFGSDIVFAKSWMDDGGRPTVDLSVLINPTVFLLAFIFCFILNLMSSIIPAWQASRTNIVNAINGRLR